MNRKRNGMELQKIKQIKVKGKIRNRENPLLRYWFEER